MKVLLVNGSPHKQGNTFTALQELARTLESEGLETEILQLGNKPVRGCIGCGERVVEHAAPSPVDVTVHPAAAERLGDVDDAKQHKAYGGK